MPLKKVYVPSQILSKRLRKSKTVPDQSLSIDQILKRYTRGVNVSVVQRESVYIDQDEYDFEMISRMDFGDKAALADSLKRQAAEMEAQLKEDERVKGERMIAEREKFWAAQNASKGAGIGPLDNTMPVDTKLSSK